MDLSCIHKQMLDNNRKTTYNFINDFKLAMPWKVGVYEISMEYPLDYSLHEMHSVFKKNEVTSGIFKMSENDLIQYHLICNEYDNEPRIVVEFMQKVMGSAGWLHGKLYNTFVLGFGKTRKDGYKVPDLVEFVCGPITWVAFNEHGNWPAIFRTDSLSKENYLSYGHRGKDVFVYNNNHGFTRQDY